MALPQPNSDRRMNVALVGVPKSGTSMLCNALTIPGQAVVLYQPLSDAFQSERLRAQAASLGCRDEDLLAWAQRHAKWGIKEVEADSIRRIPEWNPEYLLLLVRDLRHVALSMFEMNQHIPWDLNIRRRRILDTAQVVLELYHSWPRERLVVCHYERFVSSRAQREALRQSIDWPSVEGDVSRGLATWLERPHEAARHEGRITANSVRHRRVERAKEALRFACEVAAASEPFNACFGYDY